MQSLEAIAAEISNAGTILAAGAALVDAIPAYCDDTPFAIIPEGYELRNLESMLSAPPRKRGTTVVYDADSFIAYVSDHQTEDTRLYARIVIGNDASSMTAIAVINDHGKEAAAWQDFRCSLEPSNSFEWTTWSSHNRKEFTQGEFASFLEDHMQDVVSVEGSPSGADILQMALNLEINADRKLSSKINLQSGGWQLEFVEDENKDTRARMRVFERFSIGIPVFEGGRTAYPVGARLKYRVKDGKVIFWFELIRPDLVYREAAKDQLEHIAAGVGLQWINGKVS